MAGIDASGGGAVDLETLLSDLDYAARTPAKQRSTKVTGLVEKFCSHAYHNGISTTSLSQLVDIITLPNELDQASLAALIRNLYPTGKVPDVIVVNVVASLGHGKAKPSHTVQAALLRWLIMVYDVLVNPKILSQLYAVLFNLLDTLALRTPLCHILSLITRRKHVRPFRIQLLMELTRQFGGNEAPVVGLLRIYKDYYPDVIVGDAVAGRASVFTHPNNEWRQRLGEIQSLDLARKQNGNIHRGTFRVARQNGASKRRTRSSIIPEVYTSNASETSTTLEEIENVDDFVQKLEKIEPPNQLVAVIEDPLLQKFLQLRSSDENTKRVDMWLFAYFEDQTRNPEQDGAKILEMLQSILSYARYRKVLPNACLLYLRSMLPTWNGNVGRETVLNLLTYILPDPFNELYQNTFQLLEDAVLGDGSNEPQLRLLTFYKDLLDRWACLATSRPSPSKDITEAITSVIQHATILSLTISQTSQDSKNFSTILSFHESVTVILCHPSLKSKVRITTPPAELVYTLYFTTSLTTTSRLCAILASYKRAFEAAMAPKPPGPQGKDLQTYPKDYVNHFNGFLMDLCNCLWRARALNKSDPNALGCLIDPRVTTALATYVSGLDSSLTLSSLFSFSTSPTLCLLAIAYVRELEDSMEDSIEKRHAGPVGQVSLKQLEVDGGLKLSWQDYKLGVLQYLENIGVAGVGELMYNTMKHLMAVRNKKA